MTRMSPIGMFLAFAGLGDDVAVDVPMASIGFGNRLIRGLVGVFDVGKTNHM